MVHAEHRVGGPFPKVEGDRFNVCECDSSIVYSTNPRISILQPIERQSHANSQREASILVVRLRSDLSTFESDSMSTPTSDSETYPGCDLSLSQLLHAAKKQLLNDTSDGRYAHYPSPRHQIS